MLKSYIVILPFASLERVLVRNVSHENDLIFMRGMNVLVTYIFIPIVSHIDSFCHRGKSKLGIGLFIHELLREPLILALAYTTFPGSVVCHCGCTHSYDQASVLSFPLRHSFSRAETSACHSV